MCIISATFWRIQPEPVSFAWEDQLPLTAEEMSYGTRTNFWEDSSLHIERTALRKSDRWISHKNTAQQNGRPAYQKTEHKHFYRGKCANEAHVTVAGYRQCQGIITWEYISFCLCGSIVLKWRRLRWAGHVARMGERRGVHRVLVGKPEGKRPWKTQAQMGE